MTTKHKRPLAKHVIEQMERIIRDKTAGRYRVVTSPTYTEFVLDTNKLWVTHEPIDWPEEFYAGGAKRTKVFEAIDEERQYQDDKFGDKKEQSVAGFLVLIQNELDEARLGWAKDSKGRNSVMHEIRQIAAVCVGAMEKYGTTGNAISTDDIPTDNS